MYAAGSLFLVYGKPPDRAQGWTELALDRALTQHAKGCALSHLGVLPRVVLAREESAWGLGNQNVLLSLADAEGREPDLRTHPGKVSTRCSPRLSSSEQPSSPGGPRNASSW